ncbi:RNA-directed DNA polymerase [Clostridium sp. LY3-2]|uniref:RNA-directed DNA polymerase n=1 Tax=Clostridium sp. LY3-2 TaxID=2942482 RepID=UPI002152DD8A|nr:RNA-directed DNA polymerase [Clostridium sp. LY3-2]MCR6514391.1 RNA-directed DNA polymerase [Clostridium sp. LY3-2]
MNKLYIDFINEITKEELYEGLLGYGLFSDKLPPFLSSKGFYEYCKTLKHSFQDKEKQYIYYESMRNINFPRPLGIPNPMAYQNLCKCLYDNWDNIKKYFEDKTKGELYKVSRIHIRKRYNYKSLFEMNYNSWKIDGNPELDLLIGKRYIVKADISNCFPSIYTHSLPWALIGKSKAKANRSNKEWFNKIDHYSQNMKNGETHGLIIGPHTSNLLSEIILCSIDNKLNKWEYIRNIDDFTCYVDTFDKAQKFLIELGEELRKYDLVLNHKKTEIIELPIGAMEKWINKLNTVSLLLRNDKLDYKGARAYLDLTIDLMKSNKMNSAILNYSIKVLGSLNLTPNAKEYCIKTIFHWALIYPYLIPILDENVFKVFSANISQIESITQKILKDGIEHRNYESVSYAVYFSIKYNFPLENISGNSVIESNHCIFKLLSYIYFENNNDNKSINELKKHARELNGNDDDFNRNWLFVYEVLPASSLKGEWKSMKKNKISFINI